MLTYLEGARFKLQSALLELDHKPRGSHPLGPHIQITRDKTGLQQSILKVPQWLKHDEDGKPTNNFDVPVVNGNENDTTSTIDGQNGDVIIQTNNRNKSNIEYPIGIRTGGGTTSTIIVNSQNAENLDFDRGIADGGSNQHDSDFGKIWSFLVALRHSRRKSGHFQNTYLFFQMNSHPKTKMMISMVAVIRYKMQIDDRHQKPQCQK